MLRYTQDDINQIRKTLDTRLFVIIIDDLDRTDPALIGKLFLCLREMLDITGFRFLVPFDEQVISTALTKSNPAWSDGNRFLEKILDFRF